MSTLEVLQELLIKDYRLTREQLGADAPLTGLGVDSLGMIELMFQVEDRFGITLPDGKPPPMLTFGDLVNYVDNLVISSIRPPDPAAAPDAQPTR